MYKIGRQCNVLTTSVIQLSIDTFLTFRVTDIADSADGLPETLGVTWPVMWAALAVLVVVIFCHQVRVQREPVRQTESLPHSLPLLSLYRPVLIHIMHRVQYHYTSSNVAVPSCCWSLFLTRIRVMWTYLCVWVPQLLLLLCCANFIATTLWTPCKLNSSRSHKKRREIREYVPTSPRERPRRRERGQGGGKVPPMWCTPTPSWAGALYLLALVLHVNRGWDMVHNYDRIGADTYAYMPCFVTEHS